VVQHVYPETQVLPEQIEAHQDLSNMSGNSTNRKLAKKARKKAPAKKKVFQDISDISGDELF
jgi:hypothetical protein